MHKSGTFLNTLCIQKSSQVTWANLCRAGLNGCVLPGRVRMNERDCVCARNWTKHVPTRAVSQSVCVCARDWTKRVPTRAVSVCVCEIERNLCELGLSQCVRDWTKPVPTRAVSQSMCVCVRNWTKRVPTRALTHWRLPVPDRTTVPQSTFISSAPSPERQEGSGGPVEQEQMRDNTEDLQNTITFTQTAGLTLWGWLIPVNHIGLNQG